MRRYYRTYIFIFLLTILAGLLAYNYFKRPFADQNANQPSVAEQLTPTPTIAKKQLNLRQKIAQLLAVPLSLDALEQQGEAALTQDPDTREALNWIKDRQPGFVVYFGQNISTQAASLSSEVLAAAFGPADYAPLVMVDHEGGVAQRLSGEGFTKLDPWQRVVDEYTKAQQQALWQQSALELYQVGVNIVLAPVVDLASGSAVLKNRASGNFDRTYQAAEGFVYIFSQYGIMPVIKHFPGIGQSRIDLHQQAGVAELGADDTRIFSKLLDKYPNLAVMTSHLRLRDKLAGQPCSLSAECLKAFPESYPQALLITDDLGMKAALANTGSSEEKELAQVAIEAVRAGNHVLLFAEGVSWYDLDAVVRALEKEYQDSLSFRERVEAALAQVLSLKR